MTKLVEHQTRRARRVETAIDQTAAIDAPVGQIQDGCGSKWFRPGGAGRVIRIDSSNERRSFVDGPHELILRRPSQGCIEAIDRLPVGGFSCRILKSRVERYMNRGGRGRYFGE